MEPSYTENRLEAVQHKAAHFVLNHHSNISDVSEMLQFLTMHGHKSSVQKWNARQKDPDKPTHKLLRDSFAGLITG